MNSIPFKPFLYTLALALVFTSCKDDSSSSSSSPAAASNNTNVDFTGTYTGGYTYIETSKSTNQIDTTYTSNFSVEIANTAAASYLMGIPGNPSSTVNIATSGNTFTGSGGSGFFLGSTYSGKLEGDLITINEVGEDTDASWTGEIIANRPPNTGGGGGGCNTMAITGYTVNAFASGSCFTEYDAAFASDQTDYIWHLSVSFDDDCDAGVSDGSYTIISDNNQSFPGTDYTVIELDLEHTGNNPDLIQLVSTDQSGSMTVSNTSGGLRIEVNGITLVDIANSSNSKTVSFCVEV